MKGAIRSFFLLGKLLLCGVLAAPAVNPALAQDYPTKTTTS